MKTTGLGNGRNNIVGGWHGHPGLSRHRVCVWSERRGRNEGRDYPRAAPSVAFQAVQKCTRQKCVCEAPDKSLAASQTFTPIFKMKGNTVRVRDAVEEQKASVYRWQLQWRLALSPAEPQHPRRMGWCMGSQMDPGTDLVFRATVCQQQSFFVLR